MNSVGKVKKTIKAVLRRLPGFGYVFAKIDAYERMLADNTKALQQTNIAWQEKVSLMQSSYDEQISVMNQTISSLNQMIEEQAKTIGQIGEKLNFQYKWNMMNKFALKKAFGAPIKVVFLIEEPSVIKNTLSVIEEMVQDKRFEVVLVNLWYKVYKGQDYTYKRPCIEGVLDVSKYTVIESYDKDADRWLDLESLLPDYVFYSRPYDFYRKESYHMGIVSQYARICYVPYGIQTISGDVEKLVVTPECGNLYYFFMDNALRKNIISEQIKGTSLDKEGKLTYLGYPGVDMLRNHGEIKDLDAECFTILWLPRWNNTENNCHFFEYKDVLADYTKKYNDCRVVFRPHSLCFSNFLNTGEVTEGELVELRKKYSEPNEIDERGNYLEAFSQSSILVADETSLIAEYFLTEKPIIFCKKEAHFSQLMEKLVEGCYVVNSAEELISALDLLKNGEDYLKEKRIQLAKETLLDYGESAACNIKEELWKDFNYQYKFSVERREDS